MSSIKLFSFRSAVVAILFVSLAGIALAAAISSPSDLSATAVSSSAIDLTWTDNSKKETGQAIERSLDGTSFTEIDTVGADVTSYSDTGLSESTTYHYRVRAYREKNNGTTEYTDYSNTDSATTGSSYAQSTYYSQSSYSYSQSSYSYAQGSY